MKIISKPSINIIDVYDICIHSYRLVTKRKFIGIKNEVFRYETNFISSMQKKIIYSGNSNLKLDGLPSNSYGLNNKDFVGLYNEKLVKHKNGKILYSQIKNVNINKCPSCGLRTISELDHFLPKQHYPMLSITPLNLVPICSDCNGIKLNQVYQNYYDLPLNPYFDDYTKYNWLSCEMIVSGTTVIFNYMIKDNVLPTKNDELKLNNHFKIYDLFKEYGKWAGSEYVNKLHAFKAHHSNNNLKQYLTIERDTYKKESLNQYLAVMYDELLNNINLLISLL